MAGLNFLKKGEETQKFWHFPADTFFFFNFWQKSENAVDLCNYLPSTEEVTRGSSQIGLSSDKSFVSLMICWWRPLEEYEDDVLEDVPNPPLLPILYMVATYCRFDLLLICKWKKISRFEKRNYSCVRYHKFFFFKS